MPAYGPVQFAIWPGDTVIAWNAEVVAAGTGGASASTAFVLGRKGSMNNTPVAVDGFFASAPGAFEVDLQVAAVDVDTQYQTVLLGNITTVDATNQTFHFVANVETAQFVRLLMRTLTNAVKVTARFTR